MTTPVPCQWDGESFYPLPRFAKRCDAEFVVGETYTLAEHKERSRETHGHYFAVVQDAWANLPEDQQERWASAEHLRKWALVQAGYRDERTFVASSKAEAQRLAAFMKPMDEYAVVLVNESAVLVYTAKSQSVRAMGRADFQKSKDAVFDVLAKVLGTDAATLTQHAARAA